MQTPEYTWDDHVFVVTMVLSSVTYGKNNYDQPLERDTVFLTCYTHTVILASTVYSAFKIS